MGRLIDTKATYPPAPSPATKEVRLTDADLRICITAVDELMDRIRLTMHGSTVLMTETRRKLAVALNVETIVTGSGK
jgi:hypothetical protein